MPHLFAVHCYFGNGKRSETVLRFSFAGFAGGGGLGLTVDCVTVVFAAPVFATSVVKCLNVRMVHSLLSGESSAAVLTGPPKAAQFVVLVLLGNEAAAYGVAAHRTSPENSSL